MAAAQSAFSGQPVATIMEILDLCGAESNAEGRARVQLAILKLSEGDENKLLHYVEAAKQDYRDVLFWTDHPEESGHDSSVLGVLRRAWAWVLPNSVHIVAISPFGNVIVACADGSLWRVCPESLSAEKISNESNFAAVLEDEEFREDWLFEGFVAAAQASLGSVGEGQCYGFNIWPVMGGTYTPDNFAIKTLTEWLAVSGDVGRQIKDLPPGTKITLDVVGDEETRASVETEQAGASRLPTYPSVESGVRGVMELLASRNYQELERFTRDAGLSAADVARVVLEYGKTVVTCPEPIEDVLDIVEVTGRIRPTWSVVVPVYTREERRSNLSIELTIVELGGERYGIALDDICVR
jgi:hypothetical protein